MSSIIEKFRLSIDLMINSFGISVYLVRYVSEGFYERVSPNFIVAVNRLNRSEKFLNLMEVNDETHTYKLYTKKRNLKFGDYIKLGQNIFEISVIEDNYDRGLDYFLIHVQLRFMPSLPTAKEAVV